jgi:hypothetical protein
MPRSTTPDPSTSLDRLLRSSSVLATLSLGWLFTGLSPALAQVRPAGPEFQVNTHSTGNAADPGITVGPENSFVIVWIRESTSTQSSSIRGRRFSASGTPTSGELPLDQQTTPVYGPLDVATAADRDFVVVWGRAQPGCPACWGDHVRGRRFQADATPLGDQFLISSGAEYIRDPAVAADTGGSFIVVWQDDLFPRGRRFGADGLPTGDEFPLPAASWGRSPDVTVLPDGGSFLAWIECTSAPPYSLVTQRYDPAGVAVGSPQIWIAPTEGWFNFALSSNPLGETVLVWTTASGTVVGRRFDADGDPLGPAFPVSNHSPAEVANPRVVIGPSGGIVVVWQSLGSPGNDTQGLSVQARRFASDGTPLGSQFQVNSYTTGPQWDPRAEILSSGRVVVTWSSLGTFGSDDDGSSIQARIFRLPFFIDGFENGTTGRWSTTTGIGP